MIRAPYRSVQGFLDPNVWAAAPAGGAVCVRMRPVCVQGVANAVGPGGRLEPLDHASRRCAARRGGGRSRRPAQGSDYGTNYVTAEERRGGVLETSDGGVRFSINSVIRYAAPGMWLRLHFTNYAPQIIYATVPYSKRDG